MPDLVVEETVLREVARRLEGLAGTLPGRAGPSALSGAADALPGSQTGDAAAAMARSWSGDGDDVRTMADELAAAIASAADGYEKTDAELAERTP